LDKNAFISAHLNSEAANKYLQRTLSEKPTMVQGVPYGPHSKDWHELALKAMIQHAAENGYDQIAVTPGAEQAKRFGLSKQVEAISLSAMDNGKYLITAQLKGGATRAEPNLDANGVAAMIGKELASKLIPAAHAGIESSAAMRAAAKSGDDAEYDRLREARKELPPTRLSGLDLDIGGEGMKGFYDRMVPSFLNKFGKKHGVQVQLGTAPIVSTPAQHHGLTEEQFQAEAPEEQQRMVRQHAYAHQGAKTEVPVHTFDITPEMREDVVKNGIPRYAGGGEVDDDSDVPRETVKAYKKAKSGKVSGETKAEFISKSKVPDVLYRGGIGHPDMSEDFLKGKARPGYSTFASTSPHVAGSYAHPDWDQSWGTQDLVGAIAPMHIKVHTVHEFPVTTNKHGSRQFSKFEFDRRAQQLKPGHALVARQVFDMGPRANVKTDPDKLYSYPSDIYAWNNGTEVKSALDKATGGSIKDKVTIQPSMDVMQYELINRKAK
jgi:hypothetical protein